VLLTALYKLSTLLTYLLTYLLTGQLSETLLSFDLILNPPVTNLIRQSRHETSVKSCYLATAG